MDIAEQIRLNPGRAYVRLPNILVRCTNGCGAYLGDRGGALGSVDSPEQAIRFESEDKAWQASRAAGWANVVPPHHVPHDRPFGPDNRMILCDGDGAGDCAEVRAYKCATVCAGCRASGWEPESAAQNRPPARA